MVEPVLCMGENDLRPFSQLTDEQLAFCTNMNLDVWEPGEDDLPDTHSIQCSIASAMLAERS